MSNVDDLVAEALRNTVDVTFRDTQFTLRPPDKWLPKFMYLLQRKGELIDALEQALGADEIDRFMMLDPSMSEIMAFIASVQSVAGDPGESPASGDSSANTPQS